ncbi:E3 ubiquitin-protein ligase hel2 [Phtheirospermum japonicum]|uniref:RING-type E3 ubiquitin transferase n=1 Tax=Phtheirospermum japonicum TaxID=374723 RepID=A0A830C3I0_9LAMI|nr:E3 ubiquitin-protein ligase hel2 [Phtheirospermum japonicum]
MDDSCAVCAESLEWVAYGACGHKDVCSTCVARLRFICDDRRCCICKTESDVVFVTKALGDYTKTIIDFSVLPSEVKEGRVGQYWYHEDTQAFFDDSDHYNMIKAMCRLSCSVCDKMEDQSDDGSRRRARFRNIEQLKGHLFHKHRLVMCSLCLEGRKAGEVMSKMSWISDMTPKIYWSAKHLFKILGGLGANGQVNEGTPGFLGCLMQYELLTQHTNTGDSEVDGTESERGGFTGHPMCHFCRTPFYGDNELFTHMSTEHYTCHLCQRQNPGQYEYYKDYDDLEIHFRGNHFICEDEGCLAKKFTVFLSEAELKIPTSFRYRRNSEQDNRRGRGGRTFRQEPADSELSFAIQASLETSSAPQSSNRGIPDRVEVTDIDFPPVESLSVTDSETSSRYRQAVSQSSRSGTLGESSFPPLPVSTGINQQLNSHADAPHKKSMAAHLRRQSDRKVNIASSSSSSPAWPTPTRTTTPAKPVINNPHAWPSVNAVAGPVSTSGVSRSVAETAHTRPQPVASSSFASSLVSSRSSGGTGRISHSSSAPNLSERNSLDASISDFPPVSAAAQARKPPATTDQASSKVEVNVHTANKSLVEKMRIALGFDEDKFTAFRDISGEYRQGLMDAEMYLSYVEQFGLSHLVPDMARLLPNAMKQKELMDAYNLNMAYVASRETGLSNGVKNHGNGSKKGKGKSVETGSSSVKNNLADNVIKTVKELQSSYSQASEEEVEVLSKDGYRGSRGKSKVVVDDSVSGTNQNPTNQNSGTGDGKIKQRKKTSKFLRARLGDGSVEALLDLKNSDPDPDPGPNAKEGSSGGLNESLPVRGVWKNGGGQRLLGVSSKGAKK